MRIEITKDVCNENVTFFADIDTITETFQCIEYYDGDFDIEQIKYAEEYLKDNYTEIEEELYIKFYQSI